MFGLIYTGVVLLCKTIRDVKDGITNTHNYSRAVSNNKLTYRDVKGALRLTQNCEPVYYETLKNGNRVLKNNNGDIVYDFDYQSKQKTINEEQIKFNKEGIPVTLLGAFKDVCPDKFHKRETIWYFLSGGEAVYQYKNDDRLYFCEKRFGADFPKYVFVDINTGVPSFLWQKTSPRAKEWLERKNKLNQELYTASHPFSGYQFNISP